MPWLVIFSIDYRPASHYSCWNALSSLRSSHSRNVFSSSTTESLCTSCKPLCPLSMIVACSLHPLCVSVHALQCVHVHVCPACCSHRFHINLNPAFVQIRFLFFCLHVDLFASLSSSPARLSWGRQHFYGNKGAWGGGWRAWLCRRPCLNRSCLKGCCELNVWTHPLVNSCLGFN